MKRDIDLQVAKLLRGVGRRDPPLHLVDVRAALQLDLQYYSASQSGALAETAHRMRVGVHQVIQRPTLLLDVVRKLSLKAIWVPDRKRILIDADEPKLKHRWNEAHEIGHSITPWHEAMLHGDHRLTLTLSCHHAVEAEANYAAGRLLFLQDRFADELLAAPVTLAAVKKLHTAFGNTLTSTLWRSVEHLTIPAIAVVGVHPHYVPEDFDWVNPCRYFIRSSAFAERFATVNEAAVFHLIRGYCAWKRKGPLGSAEVIVTDDAGEDHVFFFESFCNTYETLTLATHRRQRPSVVAV